MVLEVITAVHGNGLLGWVPLLSMPPSSAGILVCSWHGRRGNRGQVGELVSGGARHSIQSPPEGHPALPLRTVHSSTPLSQSTTLTWGHFHNHCLTDFSKHSQVGCNRQSQIRLLDYRHGMITS